MFASIAIFCFAIPSSAENKTRTVTANYEGFLAEDAEDKADPFVFQYADAKQWIDRVAKLGAVVPNEKPRVGTLKWVVPKNVFATGNMDKTFPAFSAEAPIGAKLGKTYLYEIEPFEKYRPEWFGLTDDAEGKKQAELRGKYIRELYGRFYEATETNTNRLPAPAFQVALWKLIHENKAALLDLENGAFISPDLIRDKNKAPAFIRKAKDYLKFLKGNDQIFIEKSKDWKNKVLVHMKGLPSPEAGGEVGPALLAFQNSDASASNLEANALGAGSGLGVGNAGNGSGGSGSGDPNFGGDGASLGSPSGSSLSQTGNVSPGGGFPGAGGGPSSGVPNQPTHGGPIHRSNIIPHAVPAPSGLYLGLIAIGVWLVRSCVIRSNRKKIPH
jgi:hypothetical protein